MKKSLAERTIDKMFDWEAMKHSPQYKKNGESWLRYMKQRVIKGFNISHLQIALKGKSPSKSALRAKPQPSAQQ